MFFTWRGDEFGRNWILAGARRIGGWRKWLQRGQPTFSISRVHHRDWNFYRHHGRGHGWVLQRGSASMGVRD